MLKLRIWLIKKLIGDIPVMANVTVVQPKDILSNGKEGLYHEFFVKEEENVTKSNHA